LFKVSKGRNMLLKESKGRVTYFVKGVKRA
jgi:hypothetical protein